MNLNGEDLHFLESMASLMEPWGWARPVGRMYAYLLLRSEPATLDEIAADLGISKSNASVAARTLEHCGNAVRRGEPGSRRIYYSAPEEFGSPFAAKADLLSRLIREFEVQTAREVPAEVANRLHDMGAFYAEMRDAMAAVIARHAMIATSRQAGSGVRSPAEEVVAASR